MIESSQLSSEALFAELEQVIEAAGKEQSARAWQTLCRAESNEDFDVALDFALEHELLPMSLANPVRGQIELAECNVSWVNPVEGSEMVWIPPGRFLVGPSKKFAESEGFFLARHPVTNGQFHQFLKATQYEPPAAHPNAENFLRHWDNGKVPVKLKNHPATFLSLIDALAYCHWAGMWLPTEWLWEKAARGSEGQTYPWGERLPYGTDYSHKPPTWYELAHTRQGETCPVGQFSHVRSPYGCEDLIGNISEWCLTTKAGLRDDENLGETPVKNSITSYLPNSDEEHDLKFTVVRGSCYLRRTLNTLPSSHRRTLSTTRRNKWVGFRPAYYPPRLTVATGSD